MMATETVATETMTETITETITETMTETTIKETSLFLLPYVAIYSFVNK